jgi:pyruvate dehydrogenase E2 component (dihydrolipoamide acetyltransferase)
MAEVILMPRLNAYIAKGVIDRWNKRAGESVRKGETLFESRIDKAVYHATCRSDGFLLKILLESGVPAPAGTPVAVIGEAGEDPNAVLEAWKENKAMQQEPDVQHVACRLEDRPKKRGWWSFLFGKK